MNKLICLNSQFSSVDFLESNAEDAMFSFLIENVNDIEHINLQELHDSTIYRAEDNWFSVYLNLNANGEFNTVLAEKIQEKIDLFVQLTFHPRFKRLGNKPVIFLSVPDKNQSANEFTESFQAYLILQGFGGVEWVNFKKEYSPVFLNFIYRFREAKDFQAVYYKLLEKEFFVANYMGIVNDSQLSFKEILSIKKATETCFQRDFPSNYRLLQKHFLLNTEIPVLKEKLSAAIEDLENHKIYLNLMHEEDEANKINNFYYHEYEILPAWYKKAGHLIKVIMGKRNFRSLFDNNVKKYND